MRLTRNSRAEEAIDAPGLMASIPDISLVGAPMALIGEGGEFLGANRDFSSLTGFTEPELKGMPLCMLLENAQPGKGASRGKSALTIKNGPAAHVSYTITQAPGTEISVLTVIPRTEARKLEEELTAKREELEKREKYIECFREGVLKMITDLDRSETELKGTLRNLQETQVQLVQSSKMTALGELSASLVHEISQPLTVIRGLTHGMLRTMKDSSEWHGKVRLIADAAARMEKIVKHLRTFSRSEPLVLSPVDINSVVKDAFLILNEHLLSHSIETILDLAPVPLALGNPNRLEQVVINLVTNARDAMPQGGVLTVSTKEEKTNGNPFIRLMVRDSGSGIPDDIVGKVFDPFFTTKESGKGTGLGLSISLGIVREHKGEIRVESVKGFGSAFHVIIPALSAASNPG
ncbi:two-component system, LuxR family, sensor kinase FixL [uncultured bacterium]|nr:two-component system, LuxR family, sensor kinase FixL [uncultured bacterium]